MRINSKRLLERIDRLAEIGALPGGGVCRLALTDEDKQGRDLVVSWMRALGMEISIDQIGNVMGVRRGKVNGPPVMTGSHIDTVGTGGNYDGNYGVMAGLEIVESLNEAGIETHHPLAVSFFTNEEGCRFAPDMMGSMTYVGGHPLEESWNSVGNDGARVRDELERIGYLGDVPIGSVVPRAFVELHVEQGPVLEASQNDIGIVTGVQGISWQEVTIVGTSNHAGTTPMELRRDAGQAAVAIAAGVRQIVAEMGGNQLGTCGRMTYHPNLINVIARQVIMTIDLRNPVEDLLQDAEARVKALLDRVAEQEKVSVTSRSTVRLQPVHFNPDIVDLVAAKTREMGYSHRRLVSGAGHDAGLMSRICPTGMIFVPSVGGISHNVKEFTKPEDLEAGANVLFQTLLHLLEA